MKSKIIFYFLILSWLPLAQAYPWMFFRQKEEPGIVKLDTHVSYFVKGGATVFSGVHLDYHDPTIDISLGYSYSYLEESHYFRMSELAVVFPFFFDNWKMSLGFKDILWSEADRYWNYGLWQSRYLLDVFRPVQMGLPGLYFHFEGEVLVTFMLSYFYLPDIIIVPQLKGDQVKSQNPFYVDTLDALGNFNWNIEELDSFELSRYFKPVVAFQVRHALKDSTLSLSYAYKPVNQFQYSILVPSFNLSSDTSQWQINDFKYYVVSHHLATLEGEAVLSKNLSLFASLLYEKPEKKPEELNWLSDGFEPHLTFSVLAYFNEKQEGLTNTFLTLGWTKTIDSQSQNQISNLVTESFESLFSRNFIWKEAISASIEYRDQSLFEGFLFRLRGNYALDNHFYAMSLENYIYVTSHVRLYFSADAIFHFSNQALTDNSSLISRYKDLSRLIIGGQYVF